VKQSSNALNIGRRKPSDWECLVGAALVCATCVALQPTRGV